MFVVLIPEQLQCLKQIMHAMHCHHHTDNHRDNFYQNVRIEYNPSSQNS